MRNAGRLENAGLRGCGCGEKEGRPLVALRLGLVEHLGVRELDPAFPARFSNRAAFDGTVGFKNPPRKAVSRNRPVIRPGPDTPRRAAGLLLRGTRRRGYRLGNKG